uniref:Uncharacterized protein n=1 Tax=Arundo donax TaxID=35708 RepID=A0A0A9AJ05_ARUDO
MNQGSKCLMLHHLPSWWSQGMLYSGRSIASPIPLQPLTASEDGVLIAN